MKLRHEAQPPDASRTMDCYCSWKAAAWHEKKFTPLYFIRSFCLIIIARILTIGVKSTSAITHYIFDEKPFIMVTQFLAVAWKGFYVREYIKFYSFIRIDATGVSRKTVRVQRWQITLHRYRKRSQDVVHPSSLIPTNCTSSSILTAGTTCACVGIVQWVSFPRSIIKKLF